jgi:hypothetical protein
MVGPPGVEALTDVHSVRLSIGLYDRPAERAPRRQDSVAVAMLLPGLGDSIALAGATHGPLLDHYSGHVDLVTASHRWAA